jgi:hypothetical protein
MLLTQPDGEHSNLRPALQACALAQQHLQKIRPPIVPSRARRLLHVTHPVTRLLPRHLQHVDCGIHFDAVVSATLAL